MNCKPGDMAIVIRAPYQGLIVEVLSPTILFANGLAGWMCELPRAMECERRSVLGFHGREVAKTAAIPDAWLRPISGIQDEETTDQPEEIAA